jgi:hypothetical protein
MISDQKLRRLIEWHVAKRTVPPALPVLTLAREVIELRGSRDQYPTLQLYANWAVHPKIDRVKAGSRLLASVNAQLTDPVQHFPALIAQLLSTAALRRELLALLEAEGIAGPMFDWLCHVAAADRE